MPKHWTEISIKRKKFSGKRESHTIAGTRGLQFTVKEEGTYFEWRMTHKGRAYKMHIGSVQEVSMEAAKSQCELYRQNVKGGLHPRHCLETHGDLTFQQAYDAYVMSSEFAGLKPDYQANFRYRMEKYAVDGTDISPLQSVLREKQSIFQHNKIGALKLSSITEQLARQLWSTIKDTENHSVAKIVKSHCKVVVDWTMQNKGLQLQFNPFGFSVPRLPIQKNNAFFTDAHLTLLIWEFSIQQSPKRQFFNCVLLTGWRNGEIAKMRWDEIEYGVRVPNTNQIVTVWNSPGESNKSNEATRFVLTERVVRQIESLPKLGEYVFSYGNRDAGGHDLPMTRPAKTVRKIFNKIGLSGEYKLHTLRHTMVTRLKEFDLSAADIDTFLGKKVREGSSSHNTYAHRDSFLAKLRVADTWESHLVNLGYRDTQ